MFTLGYISVILGGNFRRPTSVHLNTSLGAIPNPRQYTDARYVDVGYYFIVTFRVIKFSIVLDIGKRINEWAAVTAAAAVTKLHVRVYTWGVEC